MTLIFLSGAFVVIGGFGYSMSPELLDADGIQKLARRNVGQPVIPAAPAGEQVTETVERQVCTSVPTITVFGRRLNMEQICRPVQDAVVKFVGPTTEEMKNWEQEVANIRAIDEAAVAEEAGRISERQRSDLKDYVKDVVQIVGGLIGIFTGLLALFATVRRKKDDPSPAKYRRPWRST